MRVVLLDSDPDAPSPERTGIRKVLDDLQSVLELEFERARQPGKVYRTYVRSNEKGTHRASFTFKTTSKSVHLMLGDLSLDGQFDLCRFFGLLFEVHRGHQLCLYDYDGEKVLLVTLTHQTDELVFTLSPTR